MTLSERKKAFEEGIVKLEEELELKMVPVLSATPQGIWPAISLLEPEATEQITKE